MMTPSNSFDPNKKPKIKCLIDMSASRKLPRQVPFLKDSDDISMRRRIQSRENDFPVGKKRGPQTELEGRNTKRHKMDPDIKFRCFTLLKQVMNHPTGWVFSRPVDPVALKIPDYFDIILRPMDLGTIEDKLHKDMYSGPEEFAADIRLTFSNAILYNPPANMIHIYAKKLSAIFESKWKTVEGNVFYTSSVASQAMRNCKTRQHIPKRSLNAQVNNVETPKMPKTCIKGLSENSLKGAGFGGKHGSGLANDKQRLRPIAGKCTSSRVISSERSLRQEHKFSCDKAPKQVCHSQITSTAKLSKSDGKVSDGCTNAFEDENLCSNYQVLSFPTNGGLIAGDTPMNEIQSSPRQALLAAKLNRFADTILKAQEKMRINNPYKQDPVKLQQEMERSERLQHEEEARIKKMKATKAATRRKETELKNQRQKEREAARLKIQKMERTVFIEDNHIVIELERLGCSLPYNCCKSTRSSRVFRSFHSRSRLEELGLRINDDHLSDESDENEDGEEGEILP